MAAKFELSPAGVLIYEDLKAWAVNVLRFTLPMFGLAFFTGLSNGLTVAQALTVASTTVWGAIIDIVRKKLNETKYPIVK